jgi:hypothetical protein
VASGLVTPEMMETVVAAFMPKSESEPRRGDGGNGRGLGITWADLRPYLDDRITKEKRGRCDDLRDPGLSLRSE